MLESNSFLQQVSAGLEDTPGNVVIAGGQLAGKSTALRALWKHRGPTTLAASLLLRLVNLEEARGYFDAPWLVVGHSPKGDPFSLDLADYLQELPVGPAELTVPWAALHKDHNRFKRLLSEMLEKGSGSTGVVGLHLYLDDPTIFIDESLVWSYHLNTKAPNQIITTWRQVSAAVAAVTNHFLVFYSAQILDDAAIYTSLLEDAKGLRPHQIAHYLRSNDEFSKLSTGTVPKWV